MEAGYNTEDINKTVLTPKNLAHFYKELLCLRFPIKVADVLDLRYLINNSVDNYHLPFDIPGYRQFRDALRSAIESFGVEKERHQSRLLSILAMIRDLHYSHSIESRNAETKLRKAIRKNHKAKKQSLRYGIYAAVTSATTGLVWFMLIQPGWLIKLVVFTMAYIAWDYFHSLSTLERDLVILRNSLNKLLRKRVNAIDWKMMIEKLSLLLGFKQIKGVEVFRIEQDAPSAVH